MLDLGNKIGAMSDFESVNPKISLKLAIFLKILAKTLEYTFKYSFGIVSHFHPNYRNFKVTF